MIVYMQERFPLPLVGLMAVCFGVVNLGLFADTPSWGALALFALAYLAVLLRYRVTDEWKDFAHDSSVYPDRPLQRGAVTVRTLVLLGITALVVELVSVLALGGGPGLLAYLPFLAVSALTAVEFFARDLLARHFTASFLLHELAYLPLFGWAAFVLGAPADGQTAAGILAVCLLFVVAEIVRKFSPRFDTDGVLVRDTYPAVWGRSRAIVVIVLSLLAAAALALVAGTTAVALGVAVAFAVAIAVSRRSDRAVMALGGVSVPALALAMLV
ncbi:UbiA family prenyltransferase [Conyzicola lurida]|uniref:UbiA family prenyltransferase n=1 Tax=Conyzicola lurida TaxID=1172621 RepID=UPI00161D4976